MNHGKYRTAKISGLVISIRPQSTRLHLLNGWRLQTQFSYCGIPLLDFEFKDLSKVEQLKSEKIDDQKRIIAFQDEIKAEKNDKLDSVEKTVESEIKLYPSVIVEKSCSEALAPRKIAAVVKSVGEKEDRSKNVIVFGVPEEDSKSVDTKVLDMLERLDQKPKVVPKDWEELIFCYHPSHLSQS